MSLIRNSLYTHREANAVEIWAGVECTINRVENTYRDQLAMAGHYERPSDIERLVELGVRCVRYPVLLERHTNNPAAWQVTDGAMETFRRAGIEPIVGLIHHGSGIDRATLLDPAFPDVLAAFACTVARRYPWVRKFTPVNEPLTTARFAALYGLWYPHQSDDRSFVAALANQVLASLRCMRALREIIPGATLVSTEDLGCTHSVPTLRSQRVFENHRRWLTWDLQMGVVKPGHPLWTYLSKHADAALLREIREIALRDSDQPMVIGINHYLTSERYIDTNVANFPASTHGGNKHRRYADVEAVRVAAVQRMGPLALMEQTWKRYGKPIAITEAHLSCTREQQLLWLDEVWNAARSARSAGIDVRAVTAWAAFGSFDWNSLLTRADGSYECGLYDLRAPTPRPTALATMVKSLAATGTFAHPGLDATPWWRGDARILYGNTDTSIETSSALQPSTHTARTNSRKDTRAPLLIAGSNGTLGRALVKLAEARGLRVFGMGRLDLDITDAKQIRSCLDDVRPWAVINAAGWVRVDDAERHPTACNNVNVYGAALLAEATAERDVQFVTFSSDLVFGDSDCRPRVESDETAPLNVYGHSKADAEQQVGALAQDSLIVRTSAFFGDWDTHNFVHRTLTALANGQRVLAPSDAVVSPTYLTDLVHAVLDLLLDGERGTWHLANSGAISWLELANLSADIAGLNKRRIDACHGADIGWIAQRPMYSALSSERASVMPSLEQALPRYIGSRQWACA
ncbi:MAG: sugar nucleotide-binding protein [Phycisphaerae bacterium]|nr:sugar nucleotide-binding protein [Gemmatimonadaceae bacterium]